MGANLELSRFDEEVSPNLGFKPPGAAILVGSTHIQKNKMC